MILDDDPGSRAERSRPSERVVCVGVCHRRSPRPWAWAARSIELLSTTADDVVLPRRCRGASPPSRPRAGSARPTTGTRCLGPKGAKTQSALRRGAALASRPPPGRAGAAAATVAAAAACREVPPSCRRHRRRGPPEGAEHGADLLLARGPQPRPEEFQHPRAAPCVAIAGPCQRRGRRPTRRSRTPQSSRPRARAATRSARGAPERRSERAPRASTRARRGSRGWSGTASRS
mmetsp:Transcript_26188/g.104749  ORF Transcript_26188/g.104749 Transcript_26188/m.104749 type:complete len:233 (+) Transcript_26188:1817-2515(+)